LGVVEPAIFCLWPLLVQLGSHAVIRAIMVHEPAHMQLSQLSPLQSTHSTPVHTSCEVVQKLITRRRPLRPIAFLLAWVPTRHRGAIVPMLVALPRVHGTNPVQGLPLGPLHNTADCWRVICIVTCPPHVQLLTQAGWGQLPTAYLA
jgi:hypothetical protein